MPKKWMNIQSFSKYRVLIAIVIFSFTLRMLWLKCTIEGDEGFFGYEAWLWTQGYNPYVYATPTNPPAGLALYAMTIYLFGNSIIPIRLLNNFLFLFSIVVLYLIAKDWFGQRVGLISVFFYGIFMNAPVFQAVQAMTESFAASFVIFSVYLCYKYLRFGDKRLLFTSGVFMSIASLIRIDQAVGIFLLLLMVALSRHYALEGRTSVKKLASSIPILIIGIFVPLIVCGIYFWSQGALYDLINQNIRFKLKYYLSFSNVSLGVRFLILSEGLPLWLFSTLGIISCSLRLGRQYKYNVFLLAWMFLFVIGAVRPPNFGHHFAMIIAPASILAAISLNYALNSVYAHSNQISPHIEDDKRMLSIFLICVLILSFIPSIYFQGLQYLNLNIHWEGFINFEYGGWGPWTYNTQLELGEYLKSHTSKDGQIFVHAWWAIPYWLSEHRAPSKYISTVKDPTIFTITDEEFQRLAGMVKEGKFEYIVIVDPNLQNLELRRKEDPIIDYTLSKYYYIKTIETAQIFRIYNTAGEMKNYNFIENFPQALKEYRLQNGTLGKIENLEKVFMPKIIEVESNGSMRYVIESQTIQSAESRVHYNNIFISPNSKLRFGVGMAKWTWESGDGAQFEVFVEDDVKVDKIFSEFINPRQRIEDRKWNDYEIDLSNYAGKNVSIIFITTTGPNSDIYGDWTYWIAPEILKQWK